MRVIALPATLALLLTAGTACGQDTATPGSDDGSPMIEVTVEDGQVGPSLQEVQVGVGQPVELVVKADATGEIHVHSEPEQELTFTAGTTTLTLEVDRPGVVDVEVHDPETLVARLEVR